MEEKLAAYERDSGPQFALLTVTSLDGEYIEEYAVKVFEQWKLGHKGKDDGLLLVISAGDHKVRIEVGDGLEGEITDALSSRVIRNVIAPAFRTQDYLGGIDRAFDALMQAASGNAPALGEDSPPQRRHGNGISVGRLVFFIILFIVISSFGRRRRGFFPGFWIGGGGFGGGGGGFGGGGGGRSSGGGASGSW